jgi:hypothetical protein
MKIPKFKFSAHKGINKHLIAMPKKRLTMLLAISLVILGLLSGWAAYLWKTNDNKKLITIIDGKEYVVEDFTTQGLSKEQQQPTQPDRAKEIAELEQKINGNDNPDYADCLVLAQLYVAVGDKEKAVKYYELAKASYDKDSLDYGEFQARMNELIANLKQGN